MTEHPHQNDLARGNTRRLAVALAIVIAMLVVEVVGGLLSNSLALLSDAGHMLVDGLALTMSLLAIRIAQRPITATRTYGYHRVEIMAALANGVILVMTSAVIFYESYQRFLNPPEVKTELMLIIAGVGLASNIAGIRLLRAASETSLNVKAAFWHIIGDTISSVGVITGGLIISFTGLTVVDPLIAVIIGVIILIGAVRLVRDSSDILLEAVPKHIEMPSLMAAIKGVPGVEDVHDVHVWTITSGIYALSAHLLIQDQMVSRSAEIVAAVGEKLASLFKITHTTLQIECQTCPTACVLDVRQVGEAHPAAPAVDTGSPQ